MRFRKKHVWPILAALVAAAILALSYAYFIEPDRLVVNETTIRVRGWNEKLDGLRIVAVSDIHGGSNSIDEEKLRLIVGRINELNADLVVLLGDYVSQIRQDRPIEERDLKMPVETVAAGLKGLRAKHGVYAVLGNHDGWFDDVSVHRELERNGIDVLDHETKVLTIEGEKLVILGLKDHMNIRGWRSYSLEARELYEQADADADLIVLQHSPDVFPILSGDNAVTDRQRLFLAGHTHGGQVWLPLLGSPIVPSSYGQRYARGHVRENGRDMFVTTGIGTSILPFRFLVPPEIAVVTLRSE